MPLRQLPQSRGCGCSPEWWVLALCGAAWVVMIAGAGHNHVAASFGAVRQQMSTWLAMTLAMMLPTAIPQMRRTAQGSFWHRRHRAIAGFAAGYLLPWSAAGLLAALLLSPRWMHAATAPIALFVLAAAWQRTRLYRFARRDCHRTAPLAPLGWRADRDCAGYGCMVGAACVRSCWPLMLACASTGHGLVAMAGGCLLSMLEAWSFRPPARALLAGTLGLALYYALLGVLAPGTPHLAMRM